MTKHAEERRNGHSRARLVQATQALVGALSCDDSSSDERSKAARLARAACSYHVAGGTEERRAERVLRGLLPTLPE
jgi:hypothetical protein